MPASRVKPWKVLNLNSAQTDELRTLSKAHAVEFAKVEMVRRHTFTACRAGRFDQTVEQVTAALNTAVSVHQVRRSFDVLTAYGWWTTIEPARGGGAGGGAGRAPVRFISAFTPAEAEPVDSAETVRVAEPARAETARVESRNGARLGAPLYERFYEKPKTTTTACADAEPVTELAGVVVASQHETEPAARGVIEHQTVEQAYRAAQQAHRDLEAAEAEAQQTDELARSAKAELDQAEPSRMRELVRELGWTAAMARLNEPGAPPTAEQAAERAQKAAERAQKAAEAEQAAEAAAQASRLYEQAYRAAQQADMDLAAAEAEAQRIELLPTVTPAQVSRPRIEQVVRLAAATYVDRQAGVRNRAGYIMAMRKQLLSRLDQLLQRPDWCAWLEHADLRTVAAALVKVLTEQELRSYEIHKLDQQARAGARPLQAAG